MDFNSNGESESKECHRAISPNHNGKPIANLRYTVIFGEMGTNYILLILILIAIKSIVLKS